MTDNIIRENGKVYHYFSVEYAIAVHDNILEKTGGLSGIKDKNLIESTLEHLKNPDYYPAIEDKLTHLLYSFNKNHCFNDGNKRSSLQLAIYFLMINELEALIDFFIVELEDIVVAVAANIVNRDLLRAIVYSLIYESDYSEGLKLRIIDVKTKMIELGLITPSNL